MPDPIIAAPAATPASPETSQQVQQEKLEETVDVTKLTDEQINEQITGVPAKKEPEKPAAPSPEVTPPAQPPAPEKKEPPPAEPPAPKAEEKLYAGKYKTVDELKKGLLEIAKPLNYNPKFLERLIAFAEKTGDWQSVEETYKDLNDALSKNQKATEPAPPKPPEEETALTETEQTRNAEKFAVVRDETYRAIESSQVVQDLTEQGFDIPRTSEEFRELKAANYALAMEFSREYVRTFNIVRKEIDDYDKALTQADPHNKTAQETAKQQISELTKQLAVPYDEPKLTAFIAEALKSPIVYEDRHGIPYIRDGAILDYFRAKEFDTLAKAVKLAGELAGRTQHAEDLQTMKKDGLKSISTVPTPGAHAREPAKIDVNDDRQLAAVSEEDIDNHLKGKKSLTG